MRGVKPKCRSNLVVALLLTGCAMDSAAKTGTQAAGLVGHVGAAEDAATLCELEGLSKGIEPEEICVSARRDVDKHEKALKLLAAYGIQMSKLAGGSGPDGALLAESVLAVLDPDGIDDYADLIQNGSDALVEVVASGWVRSEIRKNVRTHGGTLMTLGLAELVYVRNALGNAREAEQEILTTLAASQGDLENLDDAPLASRLYGWPLGAQLLRIQVEERERRLAALEVRLYGFLLATAHLEQWAAKRDGYRDDQVVATLIGEAIACADWDARTQAACVPHGALLAAALQSHGLTAPTHDPSTQD